MYDYVKNKYNLNPNMVEENNLDEDNLYVKFITAPYLMLPKTIEEFLSTHKSKFWYNLRRFEKLYTKDFGELKFDIIKSKDELEEFLDKVFILFNERWKDEYLSTSWKCKDGFQKYKDAMIDMASRDEAFLAVLYNKEKELLSYAYCLEDDNTVYFYQYTTVTDNKYRKYSLGKVLLHNLLKYIVNENKFTKFDFMNGEQGYKLEWAKQKRAIYFKIEGRTIKSYIKYFLLKFKIYLQFNDLFRDKIKFLFKLKENIFGKC